MTATKQRYIPTNYVQYIPNLGDYKKDLFACYVDKTDGTHCAIFYAGKSSKPLFFNSFRTEEDMKKKIHNAISNIMSNEDAKAERALARKAPHTLKIGDILYSSWGYDQTNIDYYQVTKIVGANSVQIRPIASKITGHSSDHTDYVVPVKDQFTGEAETKRVSADNYIRIASYATASLWNGKPNYQTASGYGH